MGCVPADVPLANTTPGSRLAELSEEGAEIRRQQLRLFQSHEVAAAWELSPAPDVGVASLYALARRSLDLLGRQGNAGRHSDPVVAADRPGVARS